jgi:hypothetical protein
MNSTKANAYTATFSLFSMDLNSFHNSIYFGPLSNVGVGPTALPHMDPDSFILVCKQDPSPCPFEVPESIRISLHHFRVVIDPFQKAIRVSKNKTVQDFHFPIPQSPNTALKRFNP